MGKVEQQNWTSGLGYGDQVRSTYDDVGASVELRGSQVTCRFRFTYDDVRQLADHFARVLRGMNELRLLDGESSEP